MKDYRQEARAHRLELQQLEDLSAPEAADSIISKLLEARDKREAEIVGVVGRIESIAFKFIGPTVEELLGATKSLLPADQREKRQ